MTARVAWTLAAGLGAGLAVVPRAALADPSHLLNIGPVGAFFANGEEPAVRRAAGGGFEVSWFHYPEHRQMFGYGAFLNAMLLDENGSLGSYVSAGGEVSWWIVGLEAGVYVRGAGQGQGAAVGLHLGPYFTLGFASVAMHIGIPVVSQADPAAPGLEVGAVVGFKVPVPIVGRYPDPIPSNWFRMPSGRPLRTDGAPSLASTTAGDAWREGDAPDVAALPRDARDALARAWTDDALAEHASIAAFARLALELLALGAPPSLVADAHRAALDEVRHARLCFALASAYAGAAVDPGPLPAAVAPLATPDLAALARASFVDGCVGEGTAAAVAREASERAADRALAGALAVIADDEARHAALGWDAVAWCLDAGGAAVATALAAALRARPVPDAAGDDNTLAAHGRLGAGRERAIHRAVTSAARARLLDDARVAAAYTAGVTPVRTARPRVACRRAAVA